MEIKNISEEAGCYLFTNEKNEIIYIGKARNLKKRIHSYFQKNFHNKYFQEKIFDVKLIVTENEKEALVLEQNLIQKHRPRFNILLKDNVNYPYLEITADENPSYRLVRWLKPSKGQIYFGPFPDGSKAREILQIIERIFPLAKCKGNLEKPCFYYNIGQCSGHCWKKVEKEYYITKVEEVKKFFAGNTKDVKDKIKASIKESIRNLAFEIAEKEKKVLDKIDFFISKQNIQINVLAVEEKEEKNYFLNEGKKGKLGSIDFLGIYYNETEKENNISLFLLIYRYGKLVNSHQGVFKVWTEKEEIITSFLYQYYDKNLVPEELIVADNWEDQEIISEKFDFLIKRAANKKTKEILKLAEKNAFCLWEKNYFDNFHHLNKEESLKEIAKILEIEIPYYIECLDISNISNQNVVACFLAFVNGEKNLRKSKFYHLKENILNKSDLSWIKEASYIHYGKEKPKSINLIIVDGGKEQVKALNSVLDNLEIKIPLIGLAKDENHKTSKIVKSNLEEIDLEGKEKIKKFLTKCQEEVHNYAISFHRKLRRKSLM